MPMENDPSTGTNPARTTAIKKTDFGPLGSPNALADYWKAEITASTKDPLREKWKNRAARIVKRYRDDRGDDGIATHQKRYNILWSNVQTIMPAMYGKRPEPVVVRRYLDPDSVARVAAIILERTLCFQMDTQTKFYDAMRSALQDRLVPGIGTVWVRYQTGQKSPTSTITNDYYAKLTGEMAEVDYVYWEDFGFVSARVWEEVPAVWRIVYMNRDELIKRFGEKIGNECPLDHVPARHKSSGGGSSTETDEPKFGVFKQARVYEIWDKRTSKVIWLNTSMAVPMDVKDDPVRFPGFFPCPKPLFATNTTGNLVPSPDYAMYQDQAQELDNITQRLFMLTKALKVVGVYDQGQMGVQRMLTEGVENQLIPVDTWAAFAEKGGLKGVMDWMPLESVITVVEKLYEIRAKLIEDIYQITGISDIVRGASNPGDTATAQRIKAQFASVRLDDMKSQMGQFVTDTLRLMGWIITEFFPDETIIAQSSIMQSPDGIAAIKEAQAAMAPPAPPAPSPGGGPPTPQMAPPNGAGGPPPPMAPQGAPQMGAQMMPPPGGGQMGGVPTGPPAPPPGMPPPGMGSFGPLPMGMPMQPPTAVGIVKQAIDLLKRGKDVDFRIEIVAESMVSADMTAEREDRMAFVQATSTFLQNSLPVVKQSPELAPLIQAMMMFGIRSFKSGRDLEGVIESAISKFANTPPATPPPDPKAQAIAAKGAADAQAAQASMTANQQLHQQKMELMQGEMAKAQRDMQDQMDAHRQEMQQNNERHAEEMRQMRETTQAQVEAILIKANVQAQTARDTAAAAGEAKVAGEEAAVEARAEGAASDLAFKEAEHAQELQHADDSHQQGLQFGADDHQQTVAQGAVSHATSEGQKADSAAADLKIKKEQAAAKPKPKKK